MKQRLLKGVAALFCAGAGAAWIAALAGAAAPTIPRQSQAIPALLELPLRQRIVFASTRFGEIRRQ